MKQILFPTTYNNLSKVAYSYTQKLAFYFDAGITVVHIYQNQFPFLRGKFDLQRTVNETQKEDTGEDQWNNEINKARSFTDEMSSKEYEDITIDYIVTDGVPSEELLDIQRKNDIDLVVMGIRRHNFRDKLFGNTTYKLIDKMDCPMLLVPPDTYYMGINKIIYATAFKLGDKEAIEYLLDWCQAFKANLHILHIHKEANKKEAKNKMTLLMDDFQEEQKVGIIKTQLMQGNIKPVMEQYLDFSHTDILAVHHRDEGFWQKIKEGSLTKILAEDTEIPLLVLKTNH